MPEYICEWCDFKTNIKCKLDAHLETKKHLSNANIMEQDKDTIIKKLKEEIMFLKGKVEAYEMMLKKPNKPIEFEFESDFINYNSTDFIDSLELELNEPLIEYFAGLRIKDDDGYIEMNVNNAFEFFINNEKNNLPFIKEFQEFQTNSNIIGDIIIENVLSKCSVEVTEIYKSRFKIYKDKWLGVSDSTELLNELISSIKSHFQNYLRVFKYYYLFDSKMRCLDEHRESEIKPFLQKMSRKITLTDYEELIKYILKKIQS